MRHVLLAAMIVLGGFLTLALVAYCIASDLRVGVAVLAAVVALLVWEISKELKQTERTR